MPFMSTLQALTGRNTRDKAVRCDCKRSGEVEAGYTPLGTAVALLAGSVGPAEAAAGEGTSAAAGHAIERQPIAAEQAIDRTKC